MFFLILFSTLIAALAAWTFKFYEKYQYLKHIPSPPVWPLLGNALEFTSDINIIQQQEKMFETFNTKIIRIHLGFKTFLYTKDQNLIRDLLSHPHILSKGQGYDFYSRWLGTGLLTAPRAKWIKRRKLINPTFHMTILEQFTDTFDAKAKIMMESLQKEVGKDSVDIYPFVILCSFDIICETAMGVSSNVQLKKFSEYVEKGDRIKHIVEKRNNIPWYQWEFFYKYSKLYREEMVNSKVIQKCSDAIIEERRAELLKKQTVDGSDEKKRKPLLDTLLEATVDGLPLTNDDIREEVNTFLFAGHDTTAVAVSYALFLLANHSDIQELVFEEQQFIFADDLNRTCPLDDLNRMKYLELVIKETLRLYPSAPFISRTLTRDAELGGFLVPKGTIISTNIFALHRDPEVYPEPLKFNPERFNPAKSEGSSANCTYIPFSLGLRNCIGQKYAMLEIKAELSRIVRHFKLSPAKPKHEVQLRPQTVLISDNGVRIRLDLR